MGRAGERTTQSENARAAKRQGSKNAMEAKRQASKRRGSIDSASRPSRFIIDIPFAPTMADFFL
jgi:hypothetical protein